MSEIVPMVISAAIGVSSGSIGAYVTYRIAKKDIKRSIEEWINSETGQKAIYSIGVLLGNAIKQGVGLNTGGGKMKLENIIGSAIAGFIQSKIPIIGQQQQEGFPQG